MSNHRTPLEVAEALIGRPEKIGEIVGVHPKSPYQWRDKAGLRAAGDLPYDSHKRALLAFAAANQIPLTAEHLIWGASEEELAALLESMSAAPAFTSRREDAA
jgi:hypothetical protein